MKKMDPTLKKINYPEVRSSNMSRALAHLPDDAIVEEFWSHVDKSGGLGPDGTCWEWVGPTVSSGCGIFQYTVESQNIKKVMLTRFVHRFSFLIHNHRVSNNRAILHTCCNQKCVNPDHLYSDDFTQDLIDEKSAQLFWQNVDKTPGFGPTGDCWLWTAWLIHNYGQMTVNNKNVRATRISYILDSGEDPSPLVMCHTCDNPPCVNPHHLFPGTRKDNAVDMANKGRSHHQQKTHCVNGHELSGDNIYSSAYLNGTRFRVCKQCARDRYHRTYKERVSGNICSRGHPMLPENVHIGKRGGRYCKTCVDERRFLVEHLRI